MKDDNLRITFVSRDALTTALIFLAALIIALVVLNRWLVTELGLLSFGRVWHFFISYADFGFVRRGLLGTVLSETGLNTLFSDEYVFAYVFQAVGITTLTLLSLLFCIRKNLAGPLFTFGIACSPAFIIHSGYTTGSLDVFILQLALLNILYTRNIVVFCAVIVAGIFTHELFVLLLPAQYAALYLNHEDEKPASTSKYWFSVLVAAAAIFVIFLFGRLDTPEPQYLEFMRNRIPNAFMQHSLWSGYYEVGASVERHLSVTSELIKAVTNGTIVFLIPSLLYCLFLTMRALNHVRSSKETVLLIVAVAGPLFALFVANDFHRWTAMSANMALLLTMKLVARSGEEKSIWNLPLALFCFLAPFGGAQLDRPFPMHQFLLERFVL